MPLPCSDKDAIFAFSSDCASNIVESYVPIIQKVWAAHCWLAHASRSAMLCSAEAPHLVSSPDCRQHAAHHSLWSAHLSPPQHKNDPYGPRQKEWQQVRRGR